MNAKYEATSRPGSKPELMGALLAVVVFVVGMTLVSGGFIARLIGSVVGAVITFFLARYVYTVLNSRR